MIEPFFKAFANCMKKHNIVADGEPVIENELAAVKNHLKDMGKIAFKKLGVE